MPRELKQEDIADIVSELRDNSRWFSDVGEQLVTKQSIATLFVMIADRLESAWRREKAEVEANALAVGGIVEASRHTPGNAAALRDALEIAKKAICNHARAKHTCDSLAWENSTINANCGDILCGHRDLCEAKTAIQKALAAPARQCDVGTPEEQEDRFFDFCTKQECTMNCPIKKKWSFKCGHKPSCGVLWAQTPYEAEEGAKS